MMIKIQFGRNDTAFIPKNHILAIGEDGPRLRFVDDPDGVAVQVDLMKGDGWITYAHGSSEHCERVAGDLASEWLEDFVLFLNERGVKVLTGGDRQ